MRQTLRLFVLLLVAVPCAASAQVYPGIATGPNCDLGAGFQFGGPTWYGNQSVMAATVDVNSANWISTYGSYHPHMDFAGALYGPAGIPYNCVDSSKIASIAPSFVSYDGDSDHPLYPFTPSMLEESGSPSCPFDPNNFNTDGNDHHLLSFDIYTGFDFETWRTGYCGGKWIAANGAVWDTKSAVATPRPIGKTSADAGGLPIFPLIYKYDECVTHPTYVTINGVSSPTCGHAGRFTMTGIRCAGYNNGDCISVFAPPATHPGSTAGGGYNIEGMTIRLKASYDTSSLTGAALALANSWKYYGLRLADQGSNVYISGAADARWDTNNLLTAQSIPVSNFDVLTVNPAYFIDEGYAFTHPSDLPTLVAAPTGSAPTNSPATASNPIVVQGQSVTLTRTPGTGATYEFFSNGPPLRPADTAVTYTPQSSAPLILTSCNAFGCTNAAPVPLTVLTPPFVGVVSAVGLR